MFGIFKRIVFFLQNKYPGVFLPASPGERLVSTKEIRNVFTRGDDGRWRVGNHLLWDGFSERHAEEIAERIFDSQSCRIIDRAGNGDIYLVFDGIDVNTGVLVNVDVHQDKVKQTCENLRDQLWIEVLKNAGYDHDTTSSFVMKLFYREPEE